MMAARLGRRRPVGVQPSRRHRSKRLNGSIDNPRPMLTTPQDTDDALRPDRVEDYFRDGAAPVDALLWWQLERQDALQIALRALFQGPAGLTRLRLWVFFELMALRESRLTREA